MHSKAKLKKMKMVGCWRIDVELYKNFYAKLGVQIRATLETKHAVTHIKLIIKYKIEGFKDIFLIHASSKVLNLKTSYIHKGKK